MQMQMYSGGFSSLKFPRKLGKSSLQGQILTWRTRFFESQVTRRSLNGRLCIYIYIYLFISVCTNIYYLISPVYCLLSIVYCLLPTVYCLLSTACYLLSTIYCLECWSTGAGAPYPQSTGAGAPYPQHLKPILTFWSWQMELELDLLELANGAEAPYPQNLKPILTFWSCSSISLEYWS